MVVRQAKVPGALVLGALCLSWACGGEARSAEEPPGNGSVAASEPAAGPLPGTREAAAAAVRAPTSPDPRERAARDVRGSGAAVDDPPVSQPRLVARSADRPGTSGVGDGPAAEAAPPGDAADRSATTTGAPGSTKGSAGPEPEESPRPGMVPDPVPPAAPEAEGDDLSAPSDEASFEDAGGPEEPGMDSGSEPPIEAVTHASRPVHERLELRLEAGTVIAFTLEEGLSTRSSRAGDPFFGYVTDDVLTPEGMVLVPFGARIRGRVVAVDPSDGPDDPAVLELAVEALIDDGRAYPLIATVREVEMEARSGESAGRSAAKIGVGAAAGAILGKILGKDTESTIAGALAGAAAGTAAAFSSRDGHAEIPAGATVLIELDVPLDLGRRF